MLDNLSQPVAFATVPLGNTDTPSGLKTPPTSRTPRRGANLGSDTDVADEPILSRLTKRIGIGRDSDSRKGKSTEMASSGDDGFEDELFDEGNASIDSSKAFDITQTESINDELSESFFVIPSGNEASPMTLKRENSRLKLEVETMKKRLEATENIIHLRKEQDLQLRDSIVQATKEASYFLFLCSLASMPTLCHRLRESWELPWLANVQ